MPTHRDHPWERDLALALGRPKAQPTWRVPIAIAVIGVIGLALILTQGPEVVDSPRPAQARPAPAGAVSTLRTRFLSRASLEVRGRTTAPDGARIRLQLRAGDRLLRHVAAARNGRYRARVRLPRAMRGRSLRVRAVVAG